MSPAFSSKAVEPTGHRMTGVIQSIRHEKLFGFIRDDNNDERFFHSSGVLPSSGLRFEEMTVGQRVSFVPTKHPKKGLRAELVEACA